MALQDRHVRRGAHVVGALDHRAFFFRLQLPMGVLFVMRIEAGKIVLLVWFLIEGAETS